MVFLKCAAGDIYVVRCNTGFEASGNNIDSWPAFGNVRLAVMLKQLKVSQNTAKQLLHFQTNTASRNTLY